MPRICPQCRNHTAERACPTDGFRTVDADLYEAGGNDARIGTIFEERYRLDAVLGSGGMGTVYKAMQVVVNRPVAVKVLHPSLTHKLNEVARFQQEARSIASLNHPNVVGLVDFGQASDGCLYLVMEYLEGETLGERLDRDSVLGIDVLIDIAIQVLDVLHDAHGMGIVHRDLKPDNLFLTTVGRRENFVKVLDFGIAKVTDEEGAGVDLTATNVAIGSPRYMSPEQARAGAIGAASDIYSLGIVIYEMLTGQQAYQARSPTEYLLAHLQATPAPPMRNGEGLRGPLVDVILTCLAKKPEQRYQSADAMRLALEACRDAPLLDPSEAATWLEADADGPDADPRLAAIAGAPAWERTVEPVDTGYQTARRPASNGRLIGLLFIAVVVGLGSAAAWLVVIEPSEMGALLRDSNGAPLPAQMRAAASVEPEPELGVVEPEADAAVVGAEVIAGRAPIHGAQDGAEVGPTAAANTDLVIGAGSIDAQEAAPAIRADAADAGITAEAPAPEIVSTTVVVSPRTAAIKASDGPDSLVAIEESTAGIFSVAWGVAPDDAEGEIVVIVSAKGFKTKRVTLTSGDDQQTLRVELRARPKAGAKPATKPGRAGYEYIP